MYDLLAPVSISMVHSVLSINLPLVYPCPEIGNFSSALITYSFVISVLPKYVVLKSVLSSKLVTCDISAYTPSYLSRYMSLILSSSDIMSGIRSSFISKLLYSLLCFLSSNGPIVKLRFMLT